MQRREFLRIALLASAATMLPACDDVAQEESAAMKKTESNHSPIIVIGAGMSGLAAARALQDKGHQLLILEGRDRIGGRVWTSRLWEKQPLDLGASWIHGTKGNPLTKLADQVKAKRLKTDYENGLLYDASGQELEDEAWQELEELGDTVLEDADEAADDLSKDSSLQAMIEQESDWEQLSSQERTLLNYYVNATIEQDYAADASEISAQTLNEDDAFGGEDVLFPNGYDQLIQYVAKGLDIKLGQVVNKIDYQNKDKIIITTNQGVWSAEKVIITLPLGVLKKGAVQFNPPLPKAKTEIITKLGMGLLNKVVLRFPRPFWPKEYDFINHISSKKGEWTEWLNLYHYTDQPILMAFNASSYARQLEKRTDNEIIASGMAVLRKLFGKNIPDPTAWQITRWASDPFAYGSYSFNSVGTTLEDRTKLAQSVGNRLFFAGEATSADYPATVHGAYLSGLDSAEAVIDSF